MMKFCNLPEFTVQHRWIHRLPSCMTEVEPSVMVRIKTRATRPQPKPRLWRSHSLIQVDSRPSNHCSIIAASCRIPHSCEKSTYCNRICSLLSSPGSWRIISPLHCWTAVSLKTRPRHQWTNGNLPTWGRSHLFPGAMMRPVGRRPSRSRPSRLIRLSRLL